MLGFFKWNKADKGVNDRSCAPLTGSPATLLPTKSAEGGTLNVM